MSESVVMDTLQLRQAFGTFTTGVTVITTKGEDGLDYGLTANSFSSVSLEPPLLLWCLGDKTDCFAAFRQADYYAVHILTADQQAVSNIFAKKGADKFAGLPLDRGPGGIPLLEQYATRFVCRSREQYAGGDHLIMLGEIVDFDATGGEPLVFQGGKYVTTVV